MQNSQYYYNIFGDNKRNKFLETLKNNKNKLISRNINEVNESITNLINQKINISDENSITNLNISNEKVSVENIIIFLLKYSLKLKIPDELRKYLQEIFPKIYPYSGREIKKLFNSQISNENSKIIMDKLSYILSFVLLIVSPGELLDYEYLESNTIDNIKEINIENNRNLKKLQKEFDYYFSNSEKNEKNTILDKEIIYYNYFLNV